MIYLSENYILYMNINIKNYKFEIIFKFEAVIMSLKAIHHQNNVLEYYRSQHSLFNLLLLLGIYGLVRHNHFLPSTNELVFRIR